MSTFLITKTHDFGNSWGLTMKRVLDETEHHYFYYKTTNSPPNGKKYVTLIGYPGTVNMMYLDCTFVYVRNQNGEIEYWRARV